MQHIPANKTNEYKNSESCIALEYPFGDSDMNIAVIKLTGRYPEEGRVVNRACKEIGYVLEGEGSVTIEETTYSLHKGDAVLIEPGERLFWEGTMTLLMPCTPAWSEEQHEQVD